MAALIQPQLPQKNPRKSLDEQSSILFYKHFHIHQTSPPSRNWRARFNTPSKISKRHSQIFGYAEADSEELEMDMGNKKMIPCRK